MIRTRLFCLVATLPCFVFAAEPPKDDPFTFRPASTRMSWENVTLPQGERMGLMGFSYLLETTPGLYLGPAFYGANTGRRGGLFTGGFEAAYRYPFNKKVDIETGFYAGGGGGNAAPVGGGLMLRPHVDVLWRFGKVRAGLSYSSVRFPNGQIQSNQFGVVANLDDVFNHTSQSNTGKSYYYDERGGVGFDQIAIVGGVYSPTKNVTTVAGTPQGRVGFAGFRADQLINEYSLWGIEAAGAAAGGASGYAEVLGSYGVQVPLIPKRFYVGARASLGMGGGGAISTSGGGLAKAGLYSTLRLSRDYYLSAEGGIARAPAGDFRARYGTVQLGIMLDHPEFGGGNSTSKSTVESWQWYGSMQHYQHAARADGSKRSMDLVGFKMDRQIDPNYYLSGQAHSATHGGAGAFSVGLFGAGWNSNTTKSGLSIAAELMVGTAGGGGVSSRGGAIAQPMLYGVANIGKNWRLKAGVGKIHSVRGELDSRVADISLGYRFGVASRN